MIKSLIKNRKILWELAKNDTKARFSSSILGAVWTVLQPLVNMLVIWGVFQWGFRSSDLEGGIPFIVWYMPAFLIWNFFSEATSQASNSVIDYSYLVKKVNFNVDIIPAIKVLSNAIIHVFFIVFIVFVNMCYRQAFNIYYFQCIYYFVCVAIFSLSIGYLCAGLSPYAPDVANVITIIIQLGFWITPIFWDPSALTDTASLLLKINPMYYICMGYRDCFVYHTPFYYHPKLTIWFWFITILLWWLGTRIYMKAKINFDDVL